MVQKKRATKSKRPSEKKPARRRVIKYTQATITAERGGPPVLSPLEPSEVGVERIRRAIEAVSKGRKSL